MPELKPLDDYNFHHFISLLKERGEAPEDYYRWKYLDQPAHGQPTGFIAYLEEKPMGCIGIINRTYCAEGKEYPATWFADWFVSDGGRGRRIGEMLMQEVRKTALYNFGIPGPVKAQVVCKRAGYRAVEGLTQYTLYVNFFRCGYKRFAGSGGVKFLRGVKSLLLSMPVRLNLFAAKKLDGFARELPNAQRWSARSLEESLKRGHLKRDQDFIQWIMQMPASTSGRRLWWSIDNEELYCCGFMETDYWGLSRAVILDIQVRELHEFIWRIAVTLANAGADWITFCSMDKSHSLRHWTKSTLPLHAATQAPIDNLHLMDLDKDSSWRSFLFAS